MIEYIPNHVCDSLELYQDNCIFVLITMVKYHNKLSKFGIECKAEQQDLSTVNGPASRVPNKFCMKS